MTLIILPKEGVVSCAYPVACGGTQRYGPADWNDPGGLWDGCQYVLPSSQNSTLTVNGTWANGYRPSQLDLTYEMKPGYFFDIHDFEVRDTNNAIIGTGSGSGNGVGQFVVNIVLTFTTFDIAELRIASAGYYGTTTIDGLCFS